MNICLIPARGGSRRIPRKNIREFCGRPMMAWSIAAARDSGLFERIVVSTDDDEIAAVAVSEGAEAPFRRPSALADDHATTIAVVRHALEWLAGRGAEPQTLCCLYATAPFVQPEDLQAGARAIAEGADFALAVTDFGYPIQRALRLAPGGHVEMFDPAHALTRSQDLEPAFHDCGQFYWGRRDAWLDDQRPFFGPGTRPVMIPRYRVQDIDTPDDWIRAELLHRIMQAG